MVEEEAEYEEITVEHEDTILILQIIDWLKSHRQASIYMPFLEIAFTIITILLIVGSFAMLSNGGNRPLLANGNYVLLQQDGFKYSGSLLGNNFINKSPKITTVIRDFEKTSIYIDVPYDENWQRAAAVRIEEIIHYIVDYRSEELPITCKGRDLVFVVDLKTNYGFKRYHYQLPYDAIRGYTRRNAISKLFTKQLQSIAI